MWKEFRISENWWSFHVSRLKLNMHRPIFHNFQKEINVRNHLAYKIINNHFYLPKLFSLNILITSSLSNSRIIILAVFTRLMKKSKM